jgi:glutaredoxin 3
MMDKKVKIYTTSACPNCQQAKEYLTGRGIQFEAVDVSKDKDALQEMKQISGGARSVPVIAVGEQVILGFERAEIEKALKCLE